MFLDRFKPQQMSETKSTTPNSVTKFIREFRKLLTSHCNVPDIFNHVTQDGETYFQRNTPIRLSEKWPYKWTMESARFLEGVKYSLGGWELPYPDLKVEEDFFTKVEELFLECSPREAVTPDPSKCYIVLYKDDDPSPPRILSIRSTYGEAVQDVAKKCSLSESSARYVALEEQFLEEGRDGWYISTFTKQD